METNSPSRVATCVRVVAPIPEISSPRLEIQSQYPMSHSSSNVILFEKLEGQKFTKKDFRLWKFQMSVILRARKLLGIVDGSTP